MKVYDFSDCDFDNEILKNKNTGVFLSRKFDYKENKESRVIVSNLDEGKRLVFLINSKEIIEQIGYSEEDKKSIMKYLEEIKEDLLDSVE